MHSHKAKTSLPTSVLIVVIIDLSVIMLRLVITKCCVNSDGCADALMKPIDHHEYAIDPVDCTP